MNSSWERRFRSNGVIAAVLFLAGYIVYGIQPKVGVPAAKLVSFYDGDRTRILVSAVIFGFAVLCLMWFSAALASDLREKGKSGWGTAAVAAGAGFGVVFIVLTALRAGLAYSIAGAGNTPVTSALNDVQWVLRVLGWFPIAMLVMAGSFGLWRSGSISNGAFGAGAVALALVLLGTTTWATHGFWAPDGGYARIVPAAVMLIWIATVSVFLTRNSPAPLSAQSPMPVPAA
jgi:hypothetical protein